MGNQLFGNQSITIISREDPLKWKIIRAAHEEKNSIMSLKKEMHYPLKAVRARVKSGEIALVWKGQNMDCKRYSEGCGLCQSFSKFAFNPYMGKSITKTTTGENLFSHCSIDPLGGLKVKFGGRFSRTW
jgi:hypothetical protein